eukprot:3436698-Ditylum_brightwellii.AAC.1
MTCQQSQREKQQIWFIVNSIVEEIDGQNWAVSYKKLNSLDDFSTKEERKNNKCKSLHDLLAKAERKSNKYKYLYDLLTKAERKSHKYGLLSNNIVEEIDGKVWAVSHKKLNYLDD